MRWIDRVLEGWRGNVARPWIMAGAKVLDIGCFQGRFLASLGDRIGPSVGLDPLAIAGASGPYRLVAEPFRVPAPFEDGSFDAVVMLATLEHVANKEPLARECFRILRPGGRVVLTVPSPRVDVILAALRRLRLIDGMSLEEHHGFDPRDTPGIFGRQGFSTERWGRFQAGLNHLFVFRKPGASSTAAGSITSSTAPTLLSDLPRATHRFSGSP